MAGSSAKSAQRHDSNGAALQRGSGKIAVQLARQLVDEVMEQGLLPGDRLSPEAEMVQQYAVGRATVREALRLLEMQGLISVKTGPGGGPVLEQLRPADFARMATLHFQMRGSTYQEIYVALLAVEPLMARLAAEGQDPEGLDRLRQIVASADELDLEQDSRAFFYNSVNFHAAVCSISGNSVLDLFGSSLLAVHRPRSRSTITPLPLRSDVRTMHQMIAQAIFDGNGELAEKLMRDHVLDFRKRQIELRSAEVNERVKWE
jgi:GntR family transcriptional regulator, transcriptional repressor for pyruvate dehydrogenase complex